MNEKKTRIFFWDIVGEIVENQGNLNASVKLINKINENKKKNAFFKAFCKNQQFLKLFQGILMGIKEKLMIKNLVFCEENSEFIKEYQVFLRKYSPKVGFLLENREKLGFSDEKPIFLSEKSKEITDFWVFLEKKELRKDFKKAVFCENFFKETVIFLRKNNDKIDEKDQIFLQNFLVLAMNKWCKFIDFSMNFDEKITNLFKLMSFSLEIITIFKGNVEKSNDFNAFLNKTRFQEKTMKKMLKDMFLKDFIDKNKEKKGKIGLIYDENSYKTLDISGFMRFYHKIQGFLQENPSFGLFQWVFLLFIKVKEISCFSLNLIFLSGFSTIYFL